MQWYVMSVDPLSHPQFYLIGYGIHVSFRNVGQAIYQEMQAYFTIIASISENSIKSNIYNCFSCLVVLFSNP